MKKLLIFTALFSVLSGLAQAAEKKTELPDCCKKPAAAEKGGKKEEGKPLTDQSLYQLDSKWTTQKGQKIYLRERRGEAQVLVMFFANCEYACPIIINDLKKIEAALPDDAKAHTKFLLVSFDTERDTPETLRKFAKKIEVDQDRWTFLHGNPDDVLELAALLGVKYKKDSRGQFSHSNIITVLNTEGEIANQQFGLNLEITPTVETLKSIAKKKFGKAAETL